MWNIHILKSDGSVDHQEVAPTDTLHVAIDTVVYHAGLASEKYGSFQITCTSHAVKKEV